MDRWFGKVAIVTGASAGIGILISQALVEKGLKVVGLARRVERIEELSKTLSNKPGKLYPIKCDIGVEEEILGVFKWIKDNLGPIHVLINNAGLIKPTNLTDGSTDDWRQIFNINVIGLCICTREAVRVMKEHNIAGHIIHINAICGHYVTPLPEPVMNVYPASKYAVTALTETLRQELRHFKSQIKITSISPGVVRTEFQDNFPGGIKDAVATMPALKPDDIAEAVMYVLSTQPHVQVIYCLFSK
ncbi:hypothetical protein ILUMI_12064 [Ignelater luminosus]|uniref:Dehydrogenase/reductase SDR family member 11 n=1 Tax=Ignelater luminosus TaxID=2038154 RepID=A0A8K0CUX8_IGNLU|nr:hypothetical protein ILUMI_12064 [Ignelater luminosus]